MSLLENWLPPSREHWELLSYAWQFFPVLCAVQWVTDWYPAGKSSITSKLNIPGKWAWAIMEAPGIITVLYIAWTLPGQLGIESLPIGNKTMIAAYSIHYIYRAFLFPYLNPSMSPIHILVFSSAFAWQLINGISLGGWLAGYGPSTVAEWEDRAEYIFIGLILWGWGFMANMWFDDELREIRRQAKKQEDNAAKKAGGDKKARQGVDKVYKIPKGGVWNFILYPHYVAEWIEWGGFWLVGGMACVPARTFLLNEIATMLPRALSGKRWYIEHFGKEKVAGRKAVVPGIL